MEKKQFAIITIFFFLLCSLFGQSSFDKQSSFSSLNITQPIAVTIGGEFIATGTFPAYSGERVDQFITRIHSEQKAVMLAAAVDRNTLIEIQNTIDNFALRNIKLIRENGDSLVLDLKKFRLTADFSENPYLKNNDVLIFPALNLETEFVEVAGAVNFRDKNNPNNPTPIKFQFVEGDKLKDALLFAGGIDKTYEKIERIEISRLENEGMREKLYLSELDSDLKLKAGDRIRVVGENRNKRNFRVRVEGEVHSPGYIYITKDNTTIREVIEKAGGFTKNADLQRAELIRGTSALNVPFFSQEFDMMMMQRMSNVSTQDSVAFLIDNRLRYLRGTSVVNFSEIHDTNSPSSNFIVKDNDFINIPPKMDLVYVFGQVLNPGYIEFIEGKDYQYYVNEAGGLGLTARGDIYLIKSTSRAWIELSEGKDAKVESGDFIWAAKKPYRDFDYYLTRIGSISGIIGGIATVILLFIQVF